MPRSALHHTLFYSTQAHLSCRYHLGDFTRHIHQALSLCSFCPGGSDCSLVDDVLDWSGPRFISLHTLHTAVASPMAAHVDGVGCDEVPSKSFKIVMRWMASNLL